MPGGSCAGDSRLGGSITTGGGTSAGAGIPVWSGGAGWTCVTGDCGGSGGGARVGSDGPAGIVTAGAAVDGTGIGVVIGAAGA